MPQWSKPERNDNISKQKEKIEYEAQDQERKKIMHKNNKANYKQPILLHKHQNVK